MKGIRNLKTFCVSVVLVICSLSVGYGQELDKVINLGIYSQPISFTQTKDDNFWIGGTTLLSDTSVSEKQFIIKMDMQGNILKTIVLPFDSVYIGDIISTADNGILVLSRKNSLYNELLKINKEGNILWKWSYKPEPNSTSFYIFDVIQLPNNNIVVFCHKKIREVNGNIKSVTFQLILNNLGVEISQNIVPMNLISYSQGNKPVFTNQAYYRVIPSFSSITESYDKHFILKFDLNGNLVDTTLLDVNRKYYNYLNLRGENPNKIIDCSSGGYDLDMIVRKIEDKNLIWEKKLKQKNNKKIFWFSKMLEDNKKNIVILNIETDNSPPDFPKQNNTILTVIDSSGNLISRNIYKDNFRNIPIGFMLTNDNYYAFCSIFKDEKSSKIRIVKTKSNQLTSSITGKIILDQNTNCQTDSLEKSLKNWNIQAQNSKGDAFYGITQNDGTYDILASGDSLTLSTQANSPYYQQTCTPATIKFTGTNQTIEKDLFLQKTTDCPYTTVDIATRNFRPCFESVLVVDFCNRGSATAQNAYVEVQLDANLTYLSSTKIAIPKGNNKYRFDVGDLPVDSCGQFTITTKVACDNSLLNKTLCNVAHIYPDSLCAPQDLGKIQVTGTCNGSTIKFDIKNDAPKAMDLNKNYIIIEDDVMYMQGNFKLNPNEIKPVTIQAKAGKTYRLIAEQTNPIYGAIATTAFENCSLSTNASTGFINQFPQGDDSPFEDKDCRVVTNSYDPNDKQAVPQGVNNQHLIAKNTDLEYMIRFQNKGTDTAFLVIVKDTLSAFLDPASIIPGASSHPYKFDLTDRGIAKFIFSGINLPHEKVDKEGSNGFVKFRIKQRRDLPNGTSIKNKAAIYFDYNDPIITNQTFHTIGENWAVILPNKDIATENLDVKIFPNPFSESTRIEAQISKEHNNLIFNLLDSNGRIIRSEKFSGNTLDFQREGLQSGFYFYEIMENNKRLGTGKLVVF